MQGKMKGLGKVALLLAAVSLTGCAIAPGMTMTEPAEVPDGRVRSATRKTRVSKLAMTATFTIPMLA